MVHSAIDYIYSVGAAAVAISKAAVKAWVELLRGINYYIKWAGYEGVRTTRTIIFWKGWFIPCAMKKKKDFYRLFMSKHQNITGVSTSECTVIFTNFLPFKKNEKQMSNRFRYSRPWDLSCWRGWVRYKYCLKWEWQYVVIARLKFTFRILNVVEPVPGKLSCVILLVK